MEKASGPWQVIARTGATLGAFRGFIERRGRAATGKLRPGPSGNDATGPVPRRLDDPVRSIVAASLAAGHLRIGTQERDQPTPKPEAAEPSIEDPGLGALSNRDYRAIIIRGAKAAMADHASNLAQAIAYCAFLAIPSALLVALGLFAELAGPSTVNSLMNRLSSVMPQSAIHLLSTSLTRTTQTNSGIVMVAIGFVLALWSLSGAMQTVMWAMNIAYERDETRSFVRRRLIALAMIVSWVIALALVFGLLILGPFASDWIGRQIGEPAITTWVWWTAQWPILILGLLAAFATILWLAPDTSPSRWTFISPGAVVTLIVWLVASGGFAVYANGFSSYNKTWGALSAAIIMLVWLWLSALALLLGGEINSEAERSRRLRQAKAYA
jgi:membrane protein